MLCAALGRGAGISQGLSCFRVFGKQLFLSCTGAVQSCMLARTGGAVSMSLPLTGPPQLIFPAKLGPRSWKCCKYQILIQATALIVDQSVTVMATDL